jgi:glycosyltransferase involved in cell wall biosynthesis
LQTVKNDKNSQKMDNVPFTGKILICIPAYNQAKNIGTVIKKAKNYGEVIVYDDGSIDNTSEAVKAAGGLAIRSPKNRGYGIAIKRLFRIAKEKAADIMVTIDSDGQHDPTDIPSLLYPIINDGYDVVIGSRFLSEQAKQKIPKYRRFGIQTITKFTKVASFSSITDAQSGYRAYSKDAIAKILLFEDGMAVSTEILMRAKENDLTIKEVPVTIEYDLERTSARNTFAHGVGVLHYVIHFISLHHPLSFYGVGGIVLLAVAAFYTHDALQQLFSEKRYLPTDLILPTNLILISVGTFVVGVVLLVTGVILYSVKAMIQGRLRDS